MNPKIEIQLSYPFRYAWKRTGPLSVIGNTDIPAFKQPENVADLTGFSEALINTDGNFAVVVDNEDRIYAAVDRVRCFPLFYQLTPDRFILTDNIPLYETHPPIDQKAADEFLDIYCVSGDRTLLKNWKQLQAGECLSYDRTTGKLTTFRYFTFDDSGKDLVPDADMMKGVYLDVFRKLVDEVGDRTFVVPLSGGYDSRLIVACLKMAGARNIFCYTYGQADSKERHVAELVAGTLALDWHFVEYSDALLDVFLTDQWQQYAAKNHHYSSLPHEQDFFALYALKRDGLLPGDGVVLPGFLGDYFAGSMFKDKALLSDTGNYQDWYIANRGCKFIVNAVRVYEYFGLEWRLPFSAKAVLDFWFDISQGQRTYGNAYNDLVCAAFFQPLQIDMKKSDHSYRPRRLKHAFLSLIPAAWLKRYRAHREFLPEYDHNNTRHLLCLLDHSGRQKLKNMKIPFNEAHAMYFLSGLQEKAVN